jgi:hypothetical protein
LKYGYELKQNYSPEMAIQAHAVLVAQKETQMGEIKQKYFNKLVGEMVK